MGQSPNSQEVQQLWLPPGCVTGPGAQSSGGSDAGEYLRLARIGSLDALA